MELQTLTLMTLSSSAWQELWSVTSATFPAWVTMNTFMTCDTCRPVRTAVFISSQFCGWGKKCNKLVSIIESSQVVHKTNLWYRQHRLNVVLLNLEFCDELLAMLFVRLQGFRRDVLGLGAVVHVANRPNNPRAIPVLFGVVRHFQQPRENFNDSVGEGNWIRIKNGWCRWTYLFALRSSCCRAVLSGSFSFRNAVTRATVCFGFSFSTDTFQSSDEACAPKILMPPFTRALKKQPEMFVDESVYFSINFTFGNSGMASTNTIMIV